MTNDSEPPDPTPRIIAIAHAPASPVAIIGWGDPPGADGRIELPLTPYRPLSALRTEARRTIAALSPETLAVMREVASGSGSVR